ncbi:hypothetical protein, partial [Thiobacillus sp. 65-1402]
MQRANQSSPHAPLASHGETHVDRLNALWKLSVQGGLGDAERIRAMLEMAAEVLDMDLVVLGELGEHCTARYVSDRLGVFPEGSRQAVDVSLCHAVYHTRAPSHIADLAAHSRYAGNPMVTEFGMRTFSG